MKLLKCIGMSVMLFLSQQAFAQHQVKLKIIDSLTQQPLVGATVTCLEEKRGDVTDLDGRATMRLNGLGLEHLSISYIGYSTKVIPVEKFNIDLDLGNIALSIQEKETEVVTISSTRTNTRIENLPTKVEVLGTEELEEENTIKPANINSLLGDLSIIHIQPTSSSTGSQAIRMQGLGGKYTLLLRDGLPMYDGFSGSFGALSIPPIDLKQIEIIKGSSSTLYGGGAIGGLINIISKVPADSVAGSALINITTRQEQNANVFLSNHKNKWGYTLFVAQTLQKQQDVNKDGLSDIPSINQQIIHPQLFFTPNQNTNLRFGIQFSNESRKGGVMSSFHKSDTTGKYFDWNHANRTSFNYQLTHHYRRHQYSLKGSNTYFDRSTTQSSFLFHGVQWQHFAEATDFLDFGKNKFILGASLSSQNFNRLVWMNPHISNYNQTTLSLFAQHTVQWSKSFLTEVGIRYDDNLRWGKYVLPRVSFYYHPNKIFNARIGFGTGYKTPQLFTDASLSLPYRYLTMPNSALLAERSEGVNADLSYSKNIGSWRISIDEALFITRVKNITTLMRWSDAFGYSTSWNGWLGFDDPLYYNFYTSPLVTKGTDTYLRLKHEEWEIYLGYYHRFGFTQETALVNWLSPFDKFSTTIAYEIEPKWRMGVEASYTANQRISAISIAPNYWFFAAMVERKFKWGSLVLNGENLLDYRQKTLFLGNSNNPQFVPIYAPVEGRVLNLSCKVNL